MEKIVLSVSIVGAMFLASCNGNKTTNGNEVSASTAEVEAQVVDGTKLNVVPQETTIEWVGSKVGKSHHNGTIKVSEGTVTVKDGKLLAGTFTIDMNTIEVKDLEGDEKQMLESHLKGTAKPERSDDFFNVTKFPTSTFVLKSFDGTTVKGDLTIKGVTKEISFPAKVTVSDSEASIVTDKFVVNRVTYGINYGSKTVFDNLVDNIISDDMFIQVILKAKK